MNTYLKTVFDDAEKKFAGALEHFKQELGRIRTGRASVNLLDDVMVEAYGQKLPLSQLATISTPEPRVIKIEVWDDSVIMGVEKALANKPFLGSSKVEGKNIYINLQPLTGEIRQSLLKEVGKKAETARIELRKLRDAAWKEIQEAGHKGEITEDERYHAKDKLDGLIREKNKEVAQLSERKKNDILS